MTIMPMIVVEMVAASFEKFGSSSVIKIVCFSPCGFHAGTASMPPVMPSAELTAVEIAAACASLSADVAEDDCCPVEASTTTDIAA